MRAHRDIENHLPCWVLGGVFHDDLARHMAMNLVRQPIDKLGLKLRRKRANLDPDHLEKLVRQSGAST